MIDGTPEEVVAVTAAFAIPFAFLLGAIIGSFLNVVIWRVPNGMSIVRPPSACPECGHAIRGYDNIPILSWFILRGRCRDCGAPISPRYPIIEAVTSLAFAGIAALAVVGGVPWPLVPALLWFAGISIALTMIDLDVHRLPNAIVLPSYPVLVALLALASWLTGDWWALLHAAIGGAAMLLLYVVIVLVAPRGIPPRRRVRGVPARRALRCRAAAVSARRAPHGDPVRTMDAARGVARDPPRTGGRRGVSATGGACVVS